ncbi:CRISPR-associated endonuclease Cas2 [Rheinheimera sediminis]|uniref:CRISPR-associated endonuclease Cas2 n=1 Tax=Rheinheimera sp. YQF-1 TaxID=2499626 RepID=UPI000FDC5AAA|nr:CRISPR-associated endonuclease Cas2 [Rheinheimera sp. YQF-1]RVT47834.1 CRISPR-associated endonuclease Cas2 [Rheinheimera sp. YQF-1]
MHWLVCFDISDDKRRRKVVKLLQQHGERVQFSVFELRLHGQQLSELKTQVAKVIKLPDRLHYIPLCGKDLGRRMADGQGTVLYFQDYRLVT